MADNADRRKLTAILCADVKGYSKLMGDDESYTVGALKERRKVFAENIKTHGGRVVNAPGDSILAEFPSVVSAVHCAVEIQNQLEDRNAELPDNRKMVFRIGVNLGDVIQSEDAIYGDGVNIAARIETLAEPGGVSISKTVFDHVLKKLPYGYEYQGQHQVKNITNPVKVYKLLTAPEDGGKLIGMEPTVSSSKWIWPTVVVAAIVVTLIGYQVYQEIAGPKFEPASVEKMALKLPEKPSIAVLPFKNMSGDPEQEYFTDGLTEELITDLSMTPKIFVIARNSTFNYKGKSVKIKQVAEELGVRYVLEGSVRKAEDQVRITAQLIDALTGHNLWAERYDRDLKDIFALQDEITMKIINALQVEITEGEHARLWGKGTKNIEAYLKSLQAREYYLTQTREGNTLAQRFAEEAIALDPEYAPPYHVLSVTHFQDVFHRTTKSPQQSFKQAVEFIKKAIALDDSYALAYGWSGFLSTYILRKYEKGIMEAQKGVDLDPNGAHGYLYLSLTYIYAGKFEDAIQAIEKAIRFNPFPPVTYFKFACTAYIGAGRYDDAIAAGKRALKVSPSDAGSHMILAVAHSLADHQEEARIAAKEALRLNPKFSVALFRKMLPYKNQSDKKRIIEAMLDAGLPE